MASGSGRKFAHRRGDGDAWKRKKIARRRELGRWREIGLGPGEEGKIGLGILEVRENLICKFGGKTWIRD